MYNLKTVKKVLLKATLLHECFSRFLNYTNGTKSRKSSHFNSFQVNVPIYSNATQYSQMTIWFL